MTFSADATATDPSSAFPKHWEALTRSSTPVTSRNDKTKVKTPAYHSRVPGANHPPVSIRRKTHASTLPIQNASNCYCFSPTLHTCPSINHHHLPRHTFIEREKNTSMSDLFASTRCSSLHISPTLLLPMPCPFVRRNLKPMAAVERAT